MLGEKMGNHITVWDVDEYIMFPHMAYHRTMNSKEIATPSGTKKRC